MNTIVQTDTVYRVVQRADAGRHATLFALLFALAMVATPWEDIAGRVFEDKEVYLERFLYLESVFEEREISGYLDFFFHEALWDLFVRHSAQFFDVQVTTVFLAISFLCLFTFSRFLVKRHGVLSLLFLLNPLVIDFAFSQLRLALAISIAMPLFEARNKWRALPVVAVACYIHTATLLFVGMYLVARYIANWMERRQLSPALVATAVIGIGLLIAIVIGPLREGVLSSVGDRRAEYEMRPASLLYASFWIMLLAVGSLQKAALEVHDSHLLAIASLTTFASATLFGIDGVRFVSASYPFIISLLLSTGRASKPFLLTAFLSYMLAQWYFWFQ